MIADVVVDLQYGDCAKGKITHHLAGAGGYTHVLRYNGGCNAGHTIFHEGKKFVTHHVPAGVFFGVKSIIGPGCVLDPEQFFKEISELEAGGVVTKGKIFVARNTHIITQAHKAEDGTDKAIGTTKRGNGPAYRDKYARVGIRAESIPELRPYVIDLYEELHGAGNIAVLCEGAQGFGLDIDWGDYPYVTSSHCTVGGAIQNGIPPKAIRHVWGAAKIYETYVGAKKFEPANPIFKKIREFGEEYGATTGRPRQCNWLNWNLLEKAVRINGVTHLVLNKMDVLQKVGVWVVLEESREKRFDREEDMKNYLIEKLSNLGLQKGCIYFSQDKDRI